MQPFETVYLKEEEYEKIENMGPASLGVALNMTSLDNVDTILQNLESGVFSYPKRSVEPAAPFRRQILKLGRKDIRMGGKRASVEQHQVTDLLSLGNGSHRKHR